MNQCIKIKYMYMGNEIDLCIINFNAIVFGMRL